MVGRIDAGTEKSKVSTTPGAAGLHTEAWGTAAPVGSSRYPRPRGHDGGSVGSRSHLRGRPATGTVRLSARSQRLGRSKTRP